MINSFHHGPLWWASHPAQEMVCVLRTFVETARPWEQCRSNLQALGGNSNFWLMLETLGAESGSRNREGSSPKDSHLKMSPVRTAKRLSGGRDYTTDSSKQCQGAVSEGWEFHQGCSLQLGGRCRKGRAGWKGCRALAWTAALGQRQGRVQTRKSLLLLLCLSRFITADSTASKILHLLGGFKHPCLCQY